MLGAIRLREDGRVIAYALDFLRSAIPEIAFTVQVATTAAEKIRAAGREVDAFARTADDEGFRVLNTLRRGDDPREWLTLWVRRSPVETLLVVPCQRSAIR